MAGCDRGPYQVSFVQKMSLLGTTKILCIALLPKLTECGQLFRNTNSSIDIIDLRLRTNNDNNFYLMRLLI